MLQEEADNFGEVMYKSGAGQAELEECQRYMKEQGIQDTITVVWRVPRIAIKAKARSVRYMSNFGCAQVCCPLYIPCVIQAGMAQQQILENTYYCLGKANLFRIVEEGAMGAICSSAEETGRTSCHIRLTDLCAVCEDKKPALKVNRACWNPNVHLSIPVFADIADPAISQKGSAESGCKQFQMWVEDAKEAVEIIREAKRYAFDTISESFMRKHSKESPNQSVDKA